MPYGRYPERVSRFKKWAAQQVDGANLSGSATPKMGALAARRQRRRRRRRRARKGKKEE